MLYCHDIPDIAQRLIKGVNRDVILPITGWSKVQQDMSALVSDVTPLLENLCGKNLEHTYSTFWCATLGTEIPRHIDKEQVAFQIPVVQDRDWEMTYCMGNAIGQVTLPMSVGKGHLYEGMTIPHESPAYEGQRAVWLMLGYRYCDQGRNDPYLGKVSEVDTSLSIEQYAYYGDTIRSRVSANSVSEVMMQSCGYMDIVKKSAGIEGMVNSMSMGIVTDGEISHSVRPMEDKVILFPLNSDSETASVHVGAETLHCEFGKGLLLEGYPLTFHIFPQHGRRAEWAMMPFRAVR